FNCPNERSLRRCLTNLEGPVFFFNDCGNIKNNKTYKSDLKNPYCNDLVSEKNKRVIHYPVAFVHPINKLDVSKAIKCGADNNFPVVAKAGGHSHESYSIGDKNCALVVDLKNFINIDINKDNGIVVVGPGNRLGKLYWKLNNEDVAFPAGNCPSVGVGVILGGGEGRLTRKFGMSSDNIEDAQIVLANGTIVDSAKKYDDLIWALRGAGSAGYGIVTNLTLKIHPIENPLSSIRLKYNFTLSATKLLYNTMNQYGQNFDPNLAVEIIHKFSSTKPSTSVQTLYVGNASELEKCLQEFIKKSNADGPKNKMGDFNFTVEDWFHAITLQNFSKETDLDNFIDKKDKEERKPVKVKSFYVNAPGLSEKGVKSLFNFMNKMKDDCSGVIVTTLYGGGNFNNLSRTETAYVHRNFMYDIMIQIDLPLQSDGTYVEDKKARKCLTRLDKFGIKFQKKYTSNESFQNYIDRRLDDWQCRYYGENFERLVDIKKKYDPSNVFNWKQSIPIVDKRR
ncbi:24263_t:CDS:2, partial [Cetraspora pellucida]